MAALYLKASDFAAANRVAGYTWHHHQETGRMQLVSSEVDGKTGHTGGFALWKFNNH